MKYRWFFLLITVLLMNCSQQHPEYAQMKQLEYLRDAANVKFESWLQDKNPKIRKNAAAVLGRIQKTESIPQLTRALDDPNPAVQVQAAFSLGQMFSDKAQPALISAGFSTTNQKLLQEITTALGKTGDSLAFPIIDKALSGNSLSLQRAAVLATAILAYRGHIATNLLPKIEDFLLNSVDPQLRWYAAYALYRTAQPATLKSLSKALMMENEFVNIFVLKALNAVEQNITGENSKTGDSIKTAAEIFFGSQKYIDQISEKANSDALQVQLAALQLMDASKNKKFYPVILSALNDKHPHVRATAIAALNNFPQAESVLLEKLKASENWREEGLFLQTLAKINPDMALLEIEKSLQRTNWPQNIYHIAALKNIDNKKSFKILQLLARLDNMAQLNKILFPPTKNQQFSKDFLTEKFKMCDAAVTTIIAMTIADKGWTDLIPTMIEVYKTYTAPKDVEPMEAILTAMDSLNSKTALPFLKKEAENPFPKIREIAARALEHISGKISETGKSKIAANTKFDFEKISQSRAPRVKLNTSAGEILLELDPAKAPNTVENFLTLVKAGYYNGIYFHRVVPGFVIQAGDPRGDGWGGPGYAIPCEYSNLLYERGTLGMATAGKDTGGSQFFLCHAPQPHLNGRYTAFGKIISGFYVLDNIRIYDKIVKAEIVSL